MCIRKIENSSNIVRLECPLNCNVALENAILDDISPNDCGGFGSGLCSDSSGWVDVWGRECWWFEGNNDPGCLTDFMFPNGDNVTSKDACCYCGGGECKDTCFNTFDKGCTNDEEWTAIINHEIISCDWFEENDEPGCVNTYYQFLSMDNVSDPRSSCCYCSEYCQDLRGWRDERMYFGDDRASGVEGWGCWWYEEWDQPGCPLYGDKWPDSNNISARDACCYCGGYDNTSNPPVCYDYIEWYIGWVDDNGVGREYGCDLFWYNDEPGCPLYGDITNEDNISGYEACCYCDGGLLDVPSGTPTTSAGPSHRYMPSATPSLTPTGRPSNEYEPSAIPTITCYNYIGWLDSNYNGCEYYEVLEDFGCPDSIDLWPNADGITASEACCYCGGGLLEVPVCYDYIGWLDALEIGCWWYEYNLVPGCPYVGDMNPNDNGITAREACCYCGGGSSEVPSAAPNYQYQLTERPSVTCYDYVGWVDSFDVGCDFYEYISDTGCEYRWNFNANDDGISAFEACCFCGGGFNTIGSDFLNPHCDDNHADWRNIALTKYIPGEDQSCDVLEYYISVIKKQANIDLTQFYCNDLHNGTSGMKDACCICRSIVDDAFTDYDTNDEEDISCINDDLQIPKPWPQRNCEWFAQNRSRCEEFGESTILIEGSDVPTRNANEVCCVCGGGIQGCNEFNHDWVDSHPVEPFSCSQYNDNDRCAADGSGLISLGHNANTQCCVCGGGYTFNNNVIAIATDKACLDEKDWQSNNFTCSSFVDEFGAPDVDRCLAFGHLSSIHGVNASRGCCDCWYGYEADTGGGYQGVLLGKMFRVGISNYTDLEYVHNVTNGNIEENSTLYNFVRDASEAYGFGLIQYDLNELKETRGLGKVLDNTYYDACLDGE